MSGLLPDRDLHTLAQEVLAIETRMKELEREQQDAMRLFRDATVRMVEARAAKDACKAEFDILRSRSMNLLGAMKSLPPVR